MLSLLPFLKLFDEPLNCPSWLYFFILMAIAALWSVRNRGKISLDYLCVVFILICVISGLANEISAGRWIRLCLLAVVISVFGSLLRNDSLRRVHCNMLQWVLVGAAGMVVITLATVFLPNYNSGAYFGRLPGNPMLIAPVCALCFLWSLSRCLNHSRINEKYRLLDYFFLVASTLALIALSSRGAMIASAVASVVILIYKGDLKRKLLFGGVVLLMLITTVVPVTLEMQRKMQFASDKESYFASRENLWNNRILEIEEHWAEGTGFRNPQHTANEFDCFGADADAGREDAGSGWLYMMSSLGIAGFGCFLWIYGRGLWRVWCRRNVFMLSLLIMFGVHLIVESYITSAGSPLCAMLWLMIGCSAEIDAKYDRIEELPTVKAWSVRLRNRCVKNWVREVK